MAVVLQEWKGADAWKDHPLRLGLNLVGRELGRDVRLTDTSVSGLYFTVLVNEHLVRLDAVAVTSVNGRPTAGELLDDDEVIGCGNVLLRLGADVAIDPAWLENNDGAVASLAQQIAETRSWTELPVLADALQDAGCCDTDLLTACRKRGRRRAGSWVVDRLLAALAVEKAVELS
jgi:hypothetical protein